MWRLYWGIAEAFFAVLRLELGRMSFYRKYYYMSMFSENVKALCRSFQKSQKF